MVRAWEVVKNLPIEIRVSEGILSGLLNVQNKFSYNGANSLEALTDIINSFDNIEDAQSFVTNIVRADNVLGSVEGIKFTGNSNNPSVIVVDNDALPILIDDSGRSIVKKNHNIVDANSQTFFNEGFLMSLEFKTGPMIIRPRKVVVGSNIESKKVAIVGRSMGGKQRTSEVTGEIDRAYGVTDYARKLRSLGYQTEIFATRVRNDGIPYLTKEATQQMTDLMEIKGESLGIPANQAFLNSDEIRETLAYQQNQAWATKMIDEEYTIIDIGNPNNSPIYSAFYAEERRILFGDILPE